MLADQIHAARSAREIGRACDSALRMLRLRAAPRQPQHHASEDEHRNAAVKIHVRRFERSAILGVTRPVTHQDQLRPARRRIRSGCEGRAYHQKSRFNTTSATITTAASGTGRLYHGRVGVVRNVGESVNQIVQLGLRLGLRQRNSPESSPRNRWTRRRSRSRNSAPWWKETCAARVPSQPPLFSASVNPCVAAAAAVPASKSA